MDGVRVNSAKLKDLIRRSGLSHKEAARQAGISERLLRDLLNKPSNKFRPSGVVALSRVLGVDPDEIELRHCIARGCITEPAAGSVLSSRQISVRGELHDVPPEFSAWLVVGIGNLHWPKGQGVPIREKWEVSIFEGGAPGVPFDLLLWAVPPRGTAQIQDWLRNGDRTNEYPGLDAVSGVLPLAATRGLRVQG